MNLMTQSKIIQEADESDQFEQNPQYFHRNVDPGQLSTDISSLSRQVNTFISKLRNPSPIPKRIQTVIKSAVNFNQPEPTSIFNSKSQIQQISSNTQSLIDSLNWIHGPKQISNVRKVYNNYQKSSNFESQISFINSKLTPNNKKLVPSLQQIFSTPNIQNKQTKTKSKSNIKHPSKTVPINISSNSYQPKQKSTIYSSNQLPKTTNIQRKSFLREKASLNQNPLIREIHFQKKYKDLYDQFDEKETVVNQSQSKGNRKYTKVNSQNVFQSQILKQKNSTNITKKKLLQKILNLQGTIQQLKCDRLDHKRSIFRQNQIYLDQPLINRKKIFMQKLSNKMQQRSEPKFISANINMHTIFSHRNQAQNFENSGKLQKKSINTENISLRKPKSQSKVQDRKISLKKWAQQAWEGNI